MLVFSLLIWLLVLVAAGFFAYLIRHDINWDGDARRTKAGQSFSLRIEQSKYGIVALEAGVVCAATFVLECRMENAVDLWFKHRKLSIEIQTGDADFDAAIYVAADTAAAQRSLQSQQELRLLIRTLLTAGAESIRCFNGWLVARFPASLNVATTEWKVEQAVPSLFRMATLLAGEKPSRYAVAKDTVFSRSSMVFGAAVAIVATGLLMLFTPTPEHLLLRPLLAPTLLVAAVYSMLLLAFAYLLLAKTSRFHLAPWWMLMLGIAATPLLGFTTVREYNIKGPQLAAATIETEIIGKRTKRRRKNRDLYLLEMRPEEAARMHRSREIDVDYELFNSVSIGSHMRWQIRPGALGAPWIEKAAKKE